MPNIRTYESDAPIPRPSELGIESTVAAGHAAASAFGEGLGALRGVAGLIATHMAQQETSSLGAEYANTLSGLTQDWNQHASDPNAINDPGLGENWRNDKLQGALDSFGQNVSTHVGRELRDRYVDELRNHFNEKTLADESTLAGNAVKTNLEQQGNVLSQGVYSDPSTLNSALNGVALALDAQISTHNLTPAQAAQVKGELTTQINKNIAIAAARGMADKNPKEAQAFIVSGALGKYLTGDETATLSKYAADQERARANDAEREKHQAIEDANHASDLRRNEIMQSFVDPQTKAVRVPKDALSAVLADKTMNGPDKDALMGVIERLGKPDAQTMKTDPATFTALFDRIHAPDGDTKKITDEDNLNQYLGHGLNFEALNQLRAEVMGKRTAEGQTIADLKRNAVELARRELSGTNPLLGFKDPKGDENVYRFEQKFLPEFEKQVKAGKDPGELLKLDGWLGQQLNPFKRTPAQMMKDIVNSTGGLSDEIPAAVKGATQTATNPKGEKIYLLNGQWVDGSGKAAR